MLPFPSSSSFPAALKERRELRGMSRAELARAVGIHAVMPRRYEEPDCREFTRPRPGLWLEINRVLGLEVDSDDIGEDSFKNDPPGVPDEATSGPTTGLLLENASLEDVIRFLHGKGIEPTFRHTLVKEVQSQP